MDKDFKNNNSKEDYEKFSDIISKKDFNALLKVKELYHYTSLEKFYNIINSKTIRLNDIKKMNDSNELVYAKKALNNAIIKEYNKSKFSISVGDYKDTKALKIIINDILNNYFSLQKLFFSLCMTEKDNLLSQWIKYSDNATGINFGITTNDLLNYIKENKIKLLKIKYITIEELEKRFFNEAKLFLNELREVVKSDNFKKIVNVITKGDYLGYDIYYNYLNKMSNIIKNIGNDCYRYKSLDFQYEEEWRLVFSQDNDLYNKHKELEKFYSEQKMNFNLKKNELVLYKYFSIKDLYYLFDTINIAPKSKLNYIDIASFMCSKYYYTDNIKNSNITYI